MRRIVLLLVALLLSSAVQASGLFVAGDMVEVTGGALNLRDAPSTGQIVWTMPEGTQMEVIGGPVEQAGYTWWHLSGHDHSGWASEHRLKGRLVERTAHTANDVDFHMRLAPAATFPTERDDSGRATVDTAFWIAETEVTYGLWYVVYHWALRKEYTFANSGMEGSTSSGGIYPYYDDIGNEPTSKRNEPVTMVSWKDSIVWCNALSEMLGFDPVYTHNQAVIRDATNRTACDNAVQEKTNGFRLPTSNEWELAARYKGNDGSHGAIAIGGMYWTPGSYASGATANTSNSSATQAVAWYNANSGGRTREVATLSPNAIGVYDMSGNVWEWCFSHYTTQGWSGRVLRGGSWYDSNRFPELQVGRVSCNSSGARIANVPMGVGGSYGLRPVRTAL